LVLGVIEAGYHRTTQARINRQKRDLFVLFVDNCAKFLQRVMLLEEHKAVDEIWGRFNSEMQSQTGARELWKILHKLLEESVKLVRGDWGRIAFLTHDDDKVRLLDDTIAYNLPILPPGMLKREWDVGTTGTTSIVGYAAATGKAYWSNDLTKDPMYLGECPDMRSELAIPLRFSGQVVGVLDIFSNRKDWFDERKAGLVQTVADQATVLFQNARAVNPLYELISPFNPFAGPDEIYAKVIQIIETFLVTKTVSVWKRVTDGDTFKLELVAASEGFWEKSLEQGITMLPPDTFTGRAAAEGNLIHVSQTEIETQFLTREFARENGLRSMTAVPMNVGDEVYGVISATKSTG
jgi:GAF domain-containing protein